MPGSPHLIVTEILSMDLSGGGVTLRAGADFGLPSFGQIIEKDEDPALADSFFDVFFEISGPWGVLHNAVPLRIEDQITCIPPSASYRHVITNPIPLLDAAGVHVANLVTARHVTFPDQFRWQKDTLCVDMDPPCEEHIGACCDEEAQECVDDVPESQCDGRWEKDTPCDELDPPCDDDCDPDCRRDVSGDGQIRAEDLAVLLGCWGPFPPGFPCECFDKDGDGEIRAIDLASLLGSWGPCPP